MFRWLDQRAGLSPARSPRTVAQPRMASTRRRTREAVSGTFCQMGSNTRETSGRSISATGSFPNDGEGVGLQIPPLFGLDAGACGSARFSSRSSISSRTDDRGAPPPSGVPVSALRDASAGRERHVRRCGRLGHSQPAPSPRARDASWDCGGDGPPDQAVAPQSARQHQPRFLRHHRKHRPNRPVGQQG